MNYSSQYEGVVPDPDDVRPILLIPHVWIGDFVRCHTVTRVLKQRWPNRPLDVLSSSLCSSLVDYMPGVRAGIVWDLPRGRLALKKQFDLAHTLRERNYGTAVILPRTWKSAIAPVLARIPERTGFIGEVRYGLINDVRYGEGRIERFIDKCTALALPPGAKLPQEWPLPQLVVPAAERAAWRQRNNLPPNPTIVLAPGSVGPAKRWSYYPEAARLLAAAGFEVWVVGGPGEKTLAEEIVAAGGEHVRDLTGTDLRNGVLAIAAASLTISNDSGLTHIAAAIGTPTIAIFGPTDPYLWKPLNPIAAVIQSQTPPPCEPCARPVCRLEHHLCMRSIPATDVVQTARDILTRSGMIVPA
jgi:heptosyltransferase-2